MSPTFPFLAQLHAHLGPEKSRAAKTAARFTLIASARQFCLTTEWLGVSARSRNPVRPDTICLTNIA